MAPVFAENAGTKFQFCLDTKNEEKPARPARQPRRSARPPGGAPRRGFVSIIAAVSGYVRFLKEDSATGIEPSAAARSHAAKASLTRAATDRRRAVLTEQAEALAVIETVAASAARRLRAARLAPDLPSATAAAFKAEVAASLARIDAARKAALLAVRTGDFTGIEGPGHGR